MATRLIERVYNGRDNTVDLILYADKVAQDLSDVTRMIIVNAAGTVEIDSNISPTAFNWDNGTTGKVLLALGHEGITVGNYLCRLIVYDATNDDGVVWDEFILQFLDDDLD